MMNKKISLYKNSKDTVGIITTVAEELQRIKTSANKKAIDWLRKQTDKKIIDTYKKMLPGVTWSGTFSQRADEKIIEHSGFICLDFDDVNVDEYYHKLSTWEFCFATWISATGTGRKCLVKIAESNKHRQHFRALQKIWTEIDPSCINESRLCFESWDENILVNLNAKLFVNAEEQPLHFPFQNRDGIRTANTNTDIIYSKLKKWLLNKNENFESGNRNRFIFLLAGAMCRYGVEETETSQLLIAEYLQPDFDFDEIKETIKKGYKQNKENFATQNFTQLPQSTQLPIQPITRLSDQICYTDIELLNLDNTKPRYLLENYLPSTGIAFIVGQPDSYKSMFCRQFAIAVANGDADFLGIKQNTKHKRALILVSEDDERNINFLLNNQLTGLNKTAEGNLKFLFVNALEPHEILIELENQLSQQAVDLIIGDSFGDLYLNEMNNVSAVRKMLKAYDYIAKKHESLVLFIHHLTKASYSEAPHQKNVLGSAGLAQKARTVLQLTGGGGNTKYLSVLKGNFSPPKIKKESLELFFDEQNWIFKNSGCIVATDAINNYAAGNSRDNTHQKLKQLAEQIFQTKTLSHKEFCDKHNQITAKGVASANRDLKKMAELKLVEKIADGWKMV